MILTLALTFVALQEAPVEPRQPAEIVITGRKMQDELARCIARGCPPEEEVEAAMNAGVESFTAGRYEEAKATLRRSISRNRRHGARMPGKMADLYATYADVSEQEGDDDAFRLATFDSVEVLRDNLGATHPATLAAATRVGDMFVRLGKVSAADEAYKAAADDARRAGNPGLAGMLTFRRAWLAFSSGNRASARALIDTVRAEFGSDPRLGNLARVLQVRMAMAGGDEAGAEALLAEMRAAPGADPVLVSAPPYPVLDAGTPSPFSAAMEGPDLSNTSQAARPRDIRWVDIGFWVRPDGRTAEAEILRPAKDTEWARPLVTQIGKRRYAPSATSGDNLGSYRIERFTLRPAYEVPTGSRIRARTAEVTLHVVDMTKLSPQAAQP